MRIAYLHQYYRTPHMSGGTRSYEMARRFAAAGHDVHVVAAREPEHRERPRWTYEMIEGVHVHSLSVSYNNKMSTRRRLLAFAVFALYSGWKTARLRPDVLFATSTPLTIAIPAAVARLRTRAPIVFEVRDLWPEMPIAMGILKSPVSKALAGLLERFAYAISVEIVALSPGMAQGVEKRGVSPSSIHVIPNSCDLEMFDVPATAGEAFRRSRGLDLDAQLIVYCGTLGRVNGVGWLARLAHEFDKRGSRVQFLVIGDGGEHDAVATEASTLGVLGENFHMLKEVPKFEVPAILSAATVSCSLFVPVPEMESNSANKFFDTLAAGTPVLINYGGWQAELLSESGAGIVVSATDIEASADILLGLLSDSKALELSGSAARSLAESQFDRDMLAAKLLRVLERVGK